MPKDQDLKFMKEALRLARSVRGMTSPDPCVGAVIVKSGKITGEGYHNRYTTPHAEDYAIRKAGRSAKGATLFINLEPCCHFGNNPPCTEKIKKAGIKRVVAAIRDPNPLVNGRGFKVLKKAGIKVDVGLLGREASKLNEHFIKHITTGKPFVILKTAVSLDGKIATRTGESTWISGERSRKYAHYLRGIVDAVMVGIGTVLKDDPQLNVRDIKKKNLRDPLKIVLDSKARLPKDARILKDPSGVIVAVLSSAPSKKTDRLKKIGAKIITAKGRKGQIDLRDLVKKLGKMNITSIMIEGGEKIAASAIEQGIVDKVIFFIAPKIIGGKKAPTPVGGKGIEKLIHAVKLKDVTFKRIGEDIMAEGYIK